jgi:hypothetical protein
MIVIFLRTVILGVFLVSTHLIVCMDDQPVVHQREEVEQKINDLLAKRRKGFDESLNESLNGFYKAIERMSDKKLADQFKNKLYEDLFSDRSTRRLSTLSYIEPYTLHMQIATFVFSIIILAREVWDITTKGRPNKPSDSGLTPDQENAEAETATKI